MPAQTMPLQEVHTGQSATIVHVGGALALRRRFAEMGIVAGEVIRAERVAPLGDPVAYRIKGYRLSLRREEAAQIQVSIEGTHNFHA
jgi:Fe2+ transport system protein FeoA